MLLIDSNQVLLSAIINHPDKFMDDDLIKHLAINAIRANVKKFKDYGEVVICCDSRSYWRKTIYPYYKAHRKASREKSALDWNAIFRVLNQLKLDLQEHFPYKVIEVDGAEADDIIGVLARKFASLESVLIISEDKDFLQLIDRNIQIYQPKKDIIKINHTKLEIEKALKEKIIRGDRGDNISNILTDINDYIEGKRQKPITAKNIEAWLPQNPEECFAPDIYERYKRNQMLIDFNFIPEELNLEIIKAYEEALVAPKQKLYKYLVNNKMINLLECIEDF